MRRPLPQMIEANLLLPFGNAGFWRIILERDSAGSWSVRDIADRTNVHRCSVRPYIVGLVKAGYAKVVAVEKASVGRDRHKMKLIRRPLEPPRVTIDGREQKEPITDTLWRSMKMCGSFTPRDLAEIATTRERSASLSHVRSYVCLLHRAGVLRVVRRRGENTEAIYRIAVNVGGKAPKILAHRVLFDPNSNSILERESRGAPATTIEPPVKRVLNGVGAR